MQNGFSLLSRLCNLLGNVPAASVAKQTVHSTMPPTIEVCLSLAMGNGEHTLWRS
ncbi:MAG: hypothetical protein RBJ76_23875 [Stenomitos frigidus ULC029]